MKNKNSILMEIVFLQTIGPLLVIFGHTMNGLPYLNLYLSIKKFIYVFHMPLFFFIGGYLFYYTNKNRVINYKPFIKKKFKRLIIPYLFWNTLFIFPKFILTPFLSNKITLNFNTLLINYFTPRLNIWCHMWFLFAMFIVYCFAPFIKKIYEKNIYIFMIIVLSFSLASIFPFKTDFFALADLSKNTIFFLLGIMIFDKREILKNKNVNLSLIILFIISFLIWLKYDIRLTSFILAFFTLILLLIVGLLLKNIKNNIISNNNMILYLFHWPFMITIRIVLYQVLNINYVFVSLIMLIVGIIGPLLMIYIINKYKLKEKSTIVSTIIGG